MQPVVHKIAKCTEHKAHLSRAYWPPEGSDENFDRGVGGVYLNYELVFILSLVSRSSCLLSNKYKMSLILKQTTPD